MKLPQPVTLGFIAELIGGELTGDENIIIENVAENPRFSSSQDLVVVFNPDDFKDFGSIKAKVFVLPKTFDEKLNVPIIKVDKPLFALKNFLSLVQPKRFYPQSGIHPTATVESGCHIDPTAAIGANVVVGPNTSVGANTKIMANCVIGGHVIIGENCIVYPLVCIADYVKIGNNVILQQGASIGADGFAYVTEFPSVIEKRLKGDFSLDSTPNPHHKIPHVGSVVIEDYVEIGSNSTVARGTIGNTKIGRGTKIDDLVIVAHNVTIGEECLVAGMNGFGGSCTIGNKVVVAGDCGFKDHVVVGDEVIIEAMSGIMRDIPDGQVQGGIPAIPSKDRFKQMAQIRQLPRIIQDIRDLKKQLKDLLDK